MASVGGQSQRHEGSGTKPVRRVNAPLWSSAQQLWAGLMPPGRWRSIYGAGAMPRELCAATRSNIRSARASLHPGPLRANPQRRFAPIGMLRGKARCIWRQRNATAYCESPGMPSPSGTEASGARCADQAAYQHTVFMVKGLLQRTAQRSRLYLIASTAPAKPGARTYEVTL